MGEHWNVFETIGNAMGASNPATAGIGAVTGLVGGIGSLWNAFNNSPKASTKVSDYLSTDLTGKANQYTDLNSDYYKLGEEKMRRMMMDAAPTGNSLLSLAAATGGSATQAGLQRRASESKVGEGVRTGMLGMYEQGQGIGLDYNKLNYAQAGSSMESTVKQEWDVFNSKQKAWSNISEGSGGLLKYGFTTKPPAPSRSPSGLPGTA